MTPQELKEFLARQGGKSRESALDKWRREAREREERLARAREKSRNLTDSEMARWREHFEQMLARERDVLIEAAGSAMEEIRQQLRAEMKLAIAEAVDALRQEFAKRAAVEAGTLVELPNPLARHDAA